MSKTFPSLRRASGWALALTLSAAAFQAGAAELTREQVAAQTRQDLRQEADLAAIGPNDALYRWNTPERSQAIVTANRAGREIESNPTAAGTPSSRTAVTPKAE